MQSFPLYDSLFEISNKLASPPDWKQLAFAINSLTIDQCEVIYALIHHHNLVSESKPTGSSFRTKKESMLPYQGKSFEGGKGVLYTPTNFPLVLQNIISEYVRTL